MYLFLIFYNNYPLENKTTVQQVEYLDSTQTNR